MRTVPLLSLALLACGTTPPQAEPGLAVMDKDPVVAPAPSPPPTPPSPSPLESSAGYSADYFIGGLNRLMIDKRDDAGCFGLVLWNPPNPGVASEVVVDSRPDDRMVAFSGFARPCDASGLPKAAQRMTGRVSIHACSVDVDVTLHFADGQERLAAEAIPLPMFGACGHGGG